MATGNSTLVVNDLRMYVTSYVSRDSIQDIQNVMHDTYDDDSVTLAKKWVIGTVQYMSNPFDNTTLDTGNELISKMAVENKRRWEEMITSTDLTGNSRKAWQPERSITTPQLQNHLVWSLLTKLLIDHQRPRRDANKAQMS